MMVYSPPEPSSSACVYVTLFGAVDRYSLSSVTLLLLLLLSSIWFSCLLVLRWRGPRAQTTARYPFFPCSSEKFSLLPRPGSGETFLPPQERHMGECLSYSRQWQVGKSCAY